MVKSSINGQQRVNGRMLPKRFERLEIDTTRLLTAEQIDTTIQDAHKKEKEYRARVFDITLLICFVCFMLGGALLITNDYIRRQEEKDGETSLLPQRLMISGAVFMALSIIPGAVCCRISIQGEGPAKH
jgi:hypothetical protein